MEDNSNLKKKLFKSVSSLLLFSFSTSLCLFAAEFVLRAKNSKMDNYDIEMWKYSNTLKIKSDNPVIDYVHRKNKNGIFQNVKIRINNNGLRGKEVSDSIGRRILFLGGSITLGWGVREEDVMTSEIERMFLEKGEKVEVLNAGIGNYNTNRYVTRFFEDLSNLEPTDIVVNYFLRDAEDLKPSKPNFLLRNSQIAVTVWTAFKRQISGTGQKSIEENYRNVYNKENYGFKIMQKKLEELSYFAEINNIRIYLVMVPDIHNLIDYKFDYIHEMILDIAKNNNYIFIDTLPFFRGMTFESLYAMPGDPHPNALGHKIIAEAAFPFLYKNSK